MTEIDQAALDALRMELSGRYGRSESITSGELSSIVSENAEANPRTRAAIKQLMRETSMPIIGNNAGYYVAESNRDVAEYVMGLQDRIDGIKERQRLIMENWEQTQERNDDTARSTLSEAEIEAIEDDDVLEVSDFEATPQTATDGGQPEGSA